jgi:phage-related protein
MGLTLQKIEFGWPVGLPYCKPLGGGLWEARCSFPSNTIGRIIFAIIGNEMVLLNGFIKKTQKTPKDELDLARNRLRVSAHERLH